MKFVFAFAGMLIALALSACAPSDVSDIETPTQIVGADRDAHGCIGSAGYEWSQLSQECIRIWEGGSALVDVRDPEANSVAYLIGGNGDEKLELFLPVGENIMLELAEPRVWKSNTGGHVVKSNSGGEYSVFDEAGFLLFQSEHMGNGSDADLIADDTIREFGKVVSIEDGAYPMFSVSIEFPKREMQVLFSLNVEAADIDQTALNDMVGKFVSVHYTSELETDLADMYLDGVSLFNNKDGVQEHWKKVTGILDGADAPTMSDLPGRVYLDVTGHDRMSFEYYITDEMVAANGKEVTAYYVSQGRHNITKMKISED